MLGGGSGEGETRGSRRKHRRKVVEEVVEKSRQYTKATTFPLGSHDRPADDVLADKLMIAEGHTAAAPMLTRLSAPVMLVGTALSARGPVDRPLLALLLALLSKAATPSA